jgi:hypothetical protein
MLRLRSLLCLGLLWSLAAAAGTVRHSEVSHADGVYRVEMEMEIAAPVESVRAIITDYDNLDRVSRLLTESALLQSPQPGGIRRRLVSRLCLLFFCFSSTMVEDVEEIGADTVLTRLVPELSDFRSGHSRWQTVPLDGGRCLLRFQYVMEPDFWIPPLIGPLLIKRSLVREAEYTIEKIEALARAG